MDHFSQFFHRFCSLYYLKYMRKKRNDRGINLFKQSKKNREQMELLRTECHPFEQWLQFKESLKHVNNFKQMSYRLLVGEFTCLQLDVHLSAFYRT